MQRSGGGAPDSQQAPSVHASREHATFLTVPHHAPTQGGKTPLFAASYNARSRAVAAMLMRAGARPLLVTNKVSQNHAASAPDAKTKCCVLETF